MPKRICLSPQLDFPTISTAKVYFDPIRLSEPLDADISDRDHFASLKLLYEEYCRKTNYSIPSAVAAFYPTMEKRSGGYTRCLAVRFRDGSKRTFSLDRALSAVASNE
jgi:hypothetical protein